MAMLAATIDGVIGVDPHRDTLTAAVVSPAGAVLTHTQASADPTGYQAVLAFALEQIPGRPDRRCWAIEGIGSFGAGLAAFLTGHGERVVEVAGPRRPARRSSGKTDAIDAVRAAQDALTIDQLATARRRGDREALRVLLACRRGATGARVAAISQLKALIVSAPDPLRAQVRSLTAKLQIRACAALPDDPAQPPEQRMTALALRATAQRIQALVAEARLLERQISRLVQGVAPWLLELPGVGALSAAQLLVSWSHPGRCRSEAAFAALAGVSPIPASSGLVTRYRLNRGGDRQLNRALHIIAMVRLRDDPETQTYAARRRAQGKSPRDIQRCLKRSTARQLFRLLERYGRSTTILRTA
jgi:transposase